jgi:hypothetical protein
MSCFIMCSQTPTEHDVSNFSNKHVRLVVIAMGSRSAQAMNILSQARKHGVHSACSAHIHHGPMEVLTVHTVLMVLTSLTCAARSDRRTCNKAPTAHRKCTRRNGCNGKLIRKRGCSRSRRSKPRAAARTRQQATAPQRRPTRRRRGTWQHQSDVGRRVIRAPTV